jgi:transposase-like protein
MALSARSCVNNMIEQDHRGVKSRTDPMLGFKVFDNAAITIAGVELQHRIRKGPVRARPPAHSGPHHTEIWNAVLSA